MIKEKPYFKYPISPRKGGQRWRSLSTNVGAYYKFVLSSNLGRVSHARMILYIQRSVHDYLAYNRDEYEPYEVTVSKLDKFLSSIRSRGAINYYNVDIMDSSSSVHDILQITIEPSRVLERIYITFKLNIPEMKFPIWHTQ